MTVQTIIQTMTTDSEVMAAYGFDNNTAVVIQDHVMPAATAADQARSMSR